MKKRCYRFLAFASLSLALILVGMDVSLAARMGSGKSFGSRPSYSQPYKSPTQGFKQANPQQPAYPSPAYQHNQATRDALRQRGGLMGMLGGLALGGLLGAMLFGGAFEHLNLFDFLVFAGLAFLLFKLLAARRRGEVEPATVSAQTYRPESVGAVYERTADTAVRGSQAGFDTDILARKGRHLGVNRDDPVNEAFTLPADFDAEAFLSGAKAAYAHLQEAWDQADLAELRALTTDKVFSELQEQLRARTGSNRTELLDVQATLVNVRDSGNEREASVLFDVLMRETPGEAPIRVREVWHFTRPRFSKQPTWFLDGIQQVDE